MRVAAPTSGPGSGVGPVQNRDDRTTERLMHPAARFVTRSLPWHSPHCTVSAMLRGLHHSPAATATLACRGNRAEGLSGSEKPADPDLLMRSMTDWSSLVPQPANQKALLASRVFVRHYPHQGEYLHARMHLFSFPQPRL
jgi:hypothetical protein